MTHSQFSRRKPPKQPGIPVGCPRLSRGSDPVARGPRASSRGAAVAPAATSEAASRRQSLVDQPARRSEERESEPRTQEHQRRRLGNRVYLHGRAAGASRIGRSWSTGWRAAARWIADGKCGGPARVRRRCLPGMKLVVEDVTSDHTPEKRRVHAQEPGKCMFRQKRRQSLVRSRAPCRASGCLWSK